MTEVFKADGTIATANGYAPFGALLPQASSSPSSGAVNDDTELGMVYYYLRYYNPPD